MPGNEAVDIIFRALREIREEENHKVGDTFSYLDPEVQRRMREYTRDELRRKGLEPDDDLPAVIVPVAPQKPSHVSEEPVSTLTGYRGDPPVEEPQRAPWWRRWFGRR